MGNDRLAAVIGDTLSATGEKVPELFIVNLPEDEQSWKRGAMRRFRAPQRPCRPRLLG